MVSYFRIGALRHGKYRCVSGAPGSFGPHRDAFQSVAQIVDLNDRQGRMFVLAGGIELDRIVGGDHGRTAAQVGLSQGFADLHRIGGTGAL